MKQCWRWFGPEDPIALADLHQVGVQGIVTALHHIPPGQPWDEQSIADRQAVLAAAGYSWDVIPGPAASIKKLLLNSNVVI